MDDGVLIAFEGLDGSGTTTQARRIRDRIRAETDRKPYLTEEPTQGPIGSQIRLCLQGRLDLDPESLALLFAADRLDHLRTDLEPKLDDGAVVLVDRYYLSSLAYQRSEGVDAEWVREINAKARRPDLTVFLDVPPEECVRRMRADRWDEERFEAPDRLETVDEEYREAIEELESEGERIEAVDGTRPADEVEAAVFDHVEDVL